MKHSPGPWELNWAPPDQFDPLPTWDVIDAEGDTICTLEDKNAEGNAHIIGAATGLLAVLEEVLSAWQSVPENVQVPDEINDNRLWNDVENIIAEAKGNRA